MLLGRKGLRVAKTPTRLFPPRRGGRTVALNFEFEVRASLKSQSNQIWLKPSRPRKASGSRYSGSKTILPFRPFTSPLCRGTPNFVGKSVRIVAMGVKW